MAVIGVDSFHKSELVRLIIESDGMKLGWGVSVCGGDTVDSSQCPPSPGEYECQAERISLDVHALCQNLSSLQLMCLGLSELARA